MTSTPPPTLLTLPLEVRLLIYHHALPNTATADCCEQAIPTFTSFCGNTSSRRLPCNPYYPPPIPSPSPSPSPTPPQNPPSLLPTPHLPLRLTSHQLNTEILTHIPLPPLTARVCDFLCLRRALAILLRGASSYSSVAYTITIGSTAAATAATTRLLAPRHIDRIHVVSERVALLRPPLWGPSAGRQASRDAILATSATQQAQEQHEEFKRARVDRLSKNYLAELQRYWLKAWVGHLKWCVDADADAEAEVEACECESECGGGGDGDGDGDGEVDGEGASEGHEEGVGTRNRNRSRRRRNVGDPMLVGLEMVFEVRGLLRRGVVVGDRGGVERQAEGAEPR